MKWYFNFFFMVLTNWTNVDEKENLDLSIKAALQNWPWKTRLRCDQPTFRSCALLCVSNIFRWLPQFHCHWLSNCPDSPPPQKENPSVDEWTSTTLSQWIPLSWNPSRGLFRTGCLIIFKDAWIQFSLHTVMQQELILHNFNSLWGYALSPLCLLVLVQWSWNNQTLNSINAKLFITRGLTCCILWSSLHPIFPISSSLHWAR